MPPGDVHGGPHVSRTAEVMNDADCFRIGGDFLLDQFGIHHPSSGPDIDEDRLGAVEFDGVCRGRMGKGGHQYLIPRPYTAQEGEIERGGTVGDGDGYTTPDILLERLLESPDPPGIGQVTMLHHLGGGFLLSVPETGLSEADGYGH